MLNSEVKLELNNQIFSFWITDYDKVCQLKMAHNSGSWYWGRVEIIAQYSLFNANQLQNKRVQDKKYFDNNNNNNN